MNTMGQILHDNWRILAAALFSAVLVISAYLLARSVESPPLALASAETALLQAIATRDSDGDGLPDWEEALYGTDPHTIDTRNLGMPDGRAVAKGLIVPRAIADIQVATSSDGMLVDPSLPPAPAQGTLTAAFAEHFFTLYLAAREANGGADLSEAQMNDVAVQALDSLASAIAGAPDYKSAKELTVAGSGEDALREFAVQAEAVLLLNKADATKSEILYLQDALQKDDDTALSHIASIAKGYRDAAVGLAVLPVPAELAAVDLALINALMRVSEITADFARADTDPLAAMLALKQYPEAVLALGIAFGDIGDLYRTVGVSLSAGTPGAAFVNLKQNVIASQQAGGQTP